jgi:serine/threonine protein kinase
MDEPGATPPPEVKDSSPTGESSVPLFPSSVVPTVPDYDLLRRIGRGAYGDVWLARSQATGALRAAKIVWRHTFEDAKPFQREFAGIQRFERISREHPSQLALFHIGRNEPAGYFYYVMELADAAKPRSEDGGLRMEDSDDYQPLLGHPRSSIFDPHHYTAHTLRADLEKGRLPAAKVLEIGLALSEALSHLHSNGLVHRDVKPSNVIFVNGRPKLADIGLVTDASDQCSIVGTEGYLPPEGPGTPQADIFALGKVLYEAATGLDRREFPKLPENLRLWPDAPQVFELNEIILKACAQDSKDRYQTCDELHADLALLNQGKSVKQKRTREQRWVLAKNVLAMAAVLGVITVSATFLWRQSRVTRPLSANPQAVELYQQAVYEMKSDTIERRLQAYTNLTEAVKLDPGFIDAYYAMFEVYFDSYVGDKLPPHYDELANFREAVKKLRRLAPNSAQYHAAKSTVEFEEWHFDEAIAEASLAIKSNPKFLRARSNYGSYICLTCGDAVTALRELGIAEQIDPNDQYVRIDEAIAFSMARRFDLAVKQFLLLLDLEPRTTQLHLNLGDAYESDRQYEKALDEYEKFDLLNGRDPVQTKAWYQKLRTALHKQGPRGYWQAELDEVVSNPSLDPPYPYRMARINARLGNTNEVFQFLNQAYNSRDDGMKFLLCDDCFDFIHGDPRFHQLVKKMGFHPIPGVIR